jgi:hypothetical protein
MKNFYLKLISTIAFIFCFNGLVSAQCAECTPDLTCGEGENFPAVCPMESPDATAGEYYEHTITFFIPSTVVIPEFGVTATLISVTISSVAGLPFGLEFTLNDEDGVYHPSQGENYGCATICGVPLIPGNYNVVITVNALASVMGFETEQSQSFPTMITVLPGEGSTSTFVYDNLGGCGSLEVNYEATIQAPAPAITTYEWNFGNGQTSTSPNPPTVMYETDGTYSVSLTTTIQQHKLQSITLNNVTSSGWMFDEDLIDQSPDPYFIILNGDGETVYTSSAQTNTSSYTWSGLNILLDSPPYSIQFFDDDLVTDDDALGSMTLALSSGEASINAGNAQRVQSTLCYKLQTS